MRTLRRLSLSQLLFAGYMVAFLCLWIFYVAVRRAWRLESRLTEAENDADFTRDQYRHLAETRTEEADRLAVLEARAVLLLDERDAARQSLAQLHRDATAAAEVVKFPKGGKAKRPSKA